MVYITYNYLLYNVEIIISLQLCHFKIIFDWIFFDSVMKALSLLPKKQDTSLQRLTLISKKTNKTKFRKKNNNSSVVLGFMRFQ